MGRRARRRTATPARAAKSARSDAGTAPSPAASSLAPASAQATGRSRRRLAWLVGFLLVLFAAWSFTYYQKRSLRLAERAFRAGDLRTASVALASYLEQDPEDSHALALKGQMLVAEGRPAEAIRIFDRVGGPEDFAAWAKAHLMLEEWSRALPLLLMVVEINPADAQALYELAGCQMWLGQLDEALKTAERFLQVAHGQEARGWVLLASIHEQRDDPRQAAKAYAEALAYEPRASNLPIAAQNFFLKYARALFDAEQFDDARQAAQRSLALGPTADGAALLGDIESAAGREQQAERHWQRAVQLQPSHAAAREALARAALARQAPAQAREWLGPLIEQPTLSGDAAELLAQTYRQLNEENEAAAWSDRAEKLRSQERQREALDRVLIEAPQSLWARVVRAHRFASRGNWSQAETMVEQLQREAPDDAYIAELARALQNRAALPPLPASGALGAGEPWEP